MFYFNLRQYKRILYGKICEKVTQDVESKILSFNRSKINKISKIKILRSIYTTCLIMTESFYLIAILNLSHY